MESITQFRIVEKVGSQSQMLGLHVGLSMAQLANFRSKPCSDNFSVCNCIFDHWINTNGHTNYPLSWKGLYDLLVDIGHSTAAEDMKETLATWGVCI